MTQCLQTGGSLTLLKTRITCPTCNQENAVRLNRVMLEDVTFGYW